MMTVTPRPARMDILNLGAGYFTSKVSSTKTLVLVLRGCDVIMAQARPVRGQFQDLVTYRTEGISATAGMASSILCGFSWSTADS